MNKELFTKAISRFLAGVVLVAALLFLPAGTWNYPQAWLLMGILFVPMFIAGIIMLNKNPQLLKKRLNAKEEETEQRQVILLSGIMFLAAFISAGLSFRQDDRSSGRPEGDRYRTLWDRPASDVYGNSPPVSCHAAGARIIDLFCFHAAVYSDHCKTDPQ